MCVQLSQESVGGELPAPQNGVQSMCGVAVAIHRGDLTSRKGLDGASSILWRLQQQARATSAGIVSMHLKAIVWKVRHWQDGNDSLRSDLVIAQLTRFGGRHRPETFRHQQRLGHQPSLQPPIQA